MKKMLAFCALLMPLAGCQSDGLTPSTATGREPLVCSQWRALGYASKHDTPQTVDAIRRNNAARDAYCATN